MCIRDSVSHAQIRNNLFISLPVSSCYSSNQSQHAHLACPQLAISSRIKSPSFMSVRQCWPQCTCVHHHLDSSRNFSFLQQWEQNCYCPIKFPNSLVQFKHYVFFLTIVHPQIFKLVRLY